MSRRSAICLGGTVSFQRQSHQFQLIYNWIYLFTNKALIEHLSTFYSAWEIKCDILILIIIYLHNENKNVSTASKVVTVYVYTFLKVFQTYLQGIDLAFGHIFIRYKKNRTWFLYFVGLSVQFRILFYVS